MHQERPCRDSLSRFDAGASPGRALPLAVAALAVLRPGPARAGDACTRNERADDRAGGRALHLGRLQLVPAGRSLAVEAQGRPDGGRPRLPRRLLGPARLEGPLRQRRVHAAPGGAAGDQRRPLQLHAAGRRRRSRPHRLVGGGAGRGVTAGRAGRRDAGARRRPLRRHRRPGRQRAEAARRVLGGDRAGPRQRGQGRREPGRDAASRFRRPRLRAGARMDRAQRRRRDAALQAGDADRSARIRATSISWSSTPRAAARCKP